MKAAAFICGRCGSVKDLKIGFDTCPKCLIAYKADGKAGAWLDDGGGGRRLFARHALLRPERAADG